MFNLVLGHKKLKILGAVTRVLVTVETVVAGYCLTFHIDFSGQWTG